MRHNKKFNHLGRKAAHRKAMLANMAISLIEHKRITTTLQKAKELRKYVEPLITKAKTDTTASRRVVFSYLQNKYSITELGKRRSDAADMAFIELVDFDENMAKDTKKKRTRRSSKKSAAAKAEKPAAETKPVEAPVEAPAEEVAETKPVEAEESTATKPIEPQEEKTAEE